MLSRYFNALLISTFTSFIFLLPQPIFSCVDISGTSLSTSLEYSLAPDFPLNGFAAGHLGIITPGLSHSYLVVSYRYLQAHPLSKSEQDIVMNFWQNYFLSLNSISTNLSVEDSKILGYIATADTPVDETYFLKPALFTQQRLTEVIQSGFAEYRAWRSLKNTVLGLPLTETLPDDKNKKPTEWIDALTQYYLKLAEQEDNLDATLFPLVSGNNPLHFATERLAQVSKILAQDPERKSLCEQWINIQKQFFKLQSQLALKQDPEQTFTALSRMIQDFPASKIAGVNFEKQYFLAALDFYRSSPEKIKLSATSFGVLAVQAQYFGHEWASYLQQRASAVAIFKEFEQSNQGTSFHNDQISALSHIRDNLQTLYQSATNPDVKKASSSYIEVINKRLGTLDISKIYNRLELELTNLNLQNYLFLHNNDKDFTGYTPDPTKVAEILTHDAPTLSDWIYIYTTFSDISPRDAVKQQIFDYCFQQQAKSSTQVAWLLTSLALVDMATEIQKQSLIAAALTLPKTHPGYFTVRAKLITPNKHAKYLVEDAARRKIIDDTLERLQSNDDYRTKYFFLSQRATLANNVPDALSHAIFTPSARLLAIYPAKPANLKPYTFVDDYNRILDQLPLSEIYSLAHSTLLPQPHRTRLLSIVWVRANLLGQASLADKIAPELKSQIPALKPYLLGIQKAKSEDERQTQFISALLHIPHLSPVMNLNTANNWPTENNYAEIHAENFDYTDLTFLWPMGIVLRSDQDVPPAPAAFLNSQAQAQHQQEMHVLAGIRGGAEWVSLVTAKLAAKHPDDERYAELLALSIKATRFASYNKDSGASKKAYDTLHKLYPQSSWAKQTKYYF